MQREKISLSPFFYFLISLYHDSAEIATMWIAPHVFLLYRIVFTDFIKDVTSRARKQTGIYIKAASI
jgi:hypothetical protein